MTGKQNQVIPGLYRQHILAGVIIAGHQPAGIDTHGGGTGADGSQITATFGTQLMITLYDLAAATTYIRAWLAEENQWIFDGLPAEVPVVDGQGSIGPAVSVRAHSEDRDRARYDSASRTAVVRVGSLTWSVRDKAAADSMRDAWRQHRRTRPDHPGPPGTHPPTPPVTQHPSDPAGPPQGRRDRAAPVIHTQRFIHILAGGLDRVG